MLSGKNDPTIGLLLSRRRGECEPRYEVNAARPGYLGDGRVTGSTYHAVPEPAVRPMAVHENGLVIIGPPAYMTYLNRILRGTWPRLPLSNSYQHT